MNRSLLTVLACPDCRGGLSCSAAEGGGNGDVVTGTLTCDGCGSCFPIAEGIPRFVPAENYATSFGYQWKLFRMEQLDSVNRTRLSERRFYSETGWTSGWMQGRWLLEAGCGAGRFLEIAARTGAQVVGVDISQAVDAARATLGLANVHLVQASIYQPPFRPGAFDGCYCIGVIQHTPDPLRALESLPPLVRPGGRLALTIYERRRWTMLYSKYWLRPLTRRMNKRLVMGLIHGSMPVLFPLTEVLFRLPYVGRIFQFMIPVANYVHNRELTLRQRYRWALLDTFDMLTPTYDQPLTQAEAEAALQAAGVDSLQRLPNPGLNLVGVRAAATAAGTER